MESTAFTGDPFSHAACNPLRLIGMHFTMLHGMYCIQSRCMEFTAFNWDPLHKDAWNPLHSLEILDVPQGSIGDIMQSLFREKRLMGSNDHIVERE